jgi:hypothetical protein
VKVLGQSSLAPRASKGNRLPRWRDWRVGLRHIAAPPNTPLCNLYLSMLGCYFTFDYFDYVDQAVNNRTGAALQRIRVHYETFGMEWANPEGTCSLGLRLPINTFDAERCDTLEQ